MGINEKEKSRYFIAVTKVFLLEFNKPKEKFYQFRFAKIFTR